MLFLPVNYSENAVIDACQGRPENGTFGSVALPGAPACKAASCDACTILAICPALSVADACTVLVFALVHCTDNCLFVSARRLLICCAFTLFMDALPVLPMAVF